MWQSYEAPSKEIRQSKDIVTEIIRKEVKRHVLKRKETYEKNASVYIDGLEYGFEIFNKVLRMFIKIRFLIFVCLCMIVQC